MQRPGRGLVIAIDGPSGSGKSTVARAVARALGYRYLDTGAMYRAVTWATLHESVDADDAEAVVRVVTGARLDVSTDPDRPGVTVDGVDVTTEIRGEGVTAAVSAVSAVPQVRAEMVDRQRAVIGDGGIVVEGRDIGTTVVPDAPVKVFLTADADERAARRSREVAGATVDAHTIAATQHALHRRDTADSGRTASPLTQAADALVIDSTALTVDEVVDRILVAVREVADA